MAAQPVHSDPASKFPAELALMIKLNVWLVRAKLAAAAVLLALAGLIVVARGIAWLP
ncbi:hypothetical protein [Methylobacterium pseudosasicola]|uniref:hypothetical protein n=1 Tax=Methylobacterium pseudosasicola TaxID=582667 RepID=UPI001428B01A|nr:hypothetical protein [Methylobacterium pseudosasicola]